MRYEDEYEYAFYKIMCAMTETQTEVLQPPSTAEPGDRVIAPGFTQDKHWILKQKNFDKVVVDLKVNSEGQAEYKGVPLQVVGRTGFITCKTLTNCQINHAFWGVYLGHKKKLGVLERIEGFRDRSVRATQSTFNCQKHTFYKSGKRLYENSELFISHFVLDYI